MIEMVDRNEFAADVRGPFPAFRNSDPNGLQLSQGYARYCSAELKRDAVLRVLRGESLIRVANQFSVAPAKLAQWCEIALAGIDAGLRESLIEKSDPDYLVTSTTLIVPHFIKRAEQFVSENAHQRLTVNDLALASGVSVRSLFAGFQRYRKKTPKQYLKEVRLDRVRDELLRARPDTKTVTCIAEYWGFAHMGRFANEYRRQFGELPSVTLKRPYNCAMVLA